MTPTTSPQAPLTNHQQSQNADGIKHLTAVVKVMAEGMGTVVTHSAKGSKSKPTKLSSRNIWRLAGLCRVTCKSHIPPIWYEMLRADTLADCVALLKEAKKRENDLKNAGMNRPVYFESQVKKLLDMKLVPQEEYSEHSRHSAVFSFADSLPRTEGEVRRLRNHDETMNSTPEETRTYELMRKIQELEKTGKRAFAVELVSFREALTDYSVERSTLFTTGCPHYVSCWNMKRIIDGMSRTT